MSRYANEYVNLLTQLELDSPLDITDIMHLIIIIMSMVSPATMPACSAGEPGATSSTTTCPDATLWGIMKATENRRMGNMAFIT